MTFGVELISFIVNHTANDDVPVLVVTFTRVEEPSNREDFTSDIKNEFFEVFQRLDYQGNRSAHLIWCDPLKCVARWMESFFCPDS